MKDEKNVSDRAADKLEAEIRDVKEKQKGTQFRAVALKCLADPIGQMLTKFCYQDEEFATAVERCDKPLSECLEGILNKESKDKPLVSDVEAYAEAVKFYLPAAQVICSFRINLPEERDDDLVFLGEPENEKSAIILDLFDTSEV